MDFTDVALTALQVAYSGGIRSAFRQHSSADSDGIRAAFRRIRSPVPLVPGGTSVEAGASYVPLPPSIAECEDTELCGAAQPFGARGWQLVVAKHDATSGDFVHLGCLLFDPVRRLFAKPPEARGWAEVVDTELDTCGPYWFDAAAESYLVSDTVCRLGGECESLGDGFGVGWLLPGPIAGVP